MSSDKWFAAHLPYDWKNMLNMEPQLTAEQRELFVRKIEIDIEINQAKAQLLPAMLDAARDPSPEKDETIAMLSSMRLTGLRREQREIHDKLLMSSFDLEKLKEMLPMALLALNQGVNLPLLLKLLDIDPDRVKRIKELVEKFLSL